MSTKRHLRLDSLIRVSQSNGRTTQGETFRSPDQQRGVVTGWTQSSDARIVKEHESVDVSGKTMRRDDVDAALERIRAGKTDGIIVAWLDRFSRAPVDEALRVYREIQEAGGVVIAADMAGLNPNDPTGEMALTTMLAVGRMQWRQRAERWDMSKADAIADGKAIGGAPFGYVFRDPTPRSSGRGVVDSRLVIDKPRAKIVHELFERKVGGASWLELARWLDEAAPKPNQGHWSRNTVRDMIRCRTYLGEVHHGRHVKPNAHDRIVAPALWRRAQPEPGQRTPRGVYLLSGLVRCAACGWRMRASSGGRGRKPAVFTCVNRSCTARSTITVKRLDAEVIEQFFAHLDGYSVRKIEDGELEAARRVVAERENALRALAAVVPSHPIAVESHQAALAGAERELVEAEDRLYELNAARDQSGPDVHELRSDWATMTLDARRHVLRTGIDAVLVRRASSRAPGPLASDRLRVLFVGQAPRALIDNGRGVVFNGWQWLGDDDPVTPVAAA
jgi:DNA invertase Pin-like site-specific DNA recombinase